MPFVVKDNSSHKPLTVSKKSAFVNLLKSSCNLILNHYLFLLSFLVYYTKSVSKCQ
nr:MAG TPA: hypothetical protein [Inoviridae sp.]